MLNGLVVSEGTLSPAFSDYKYVTTNATTYAAITTTSSAITVTATAITGSAITITTTTTGAAITTTSSEIVGTNVVYSADVTLAPVGETTVIEITVKTTGLLDRRYIINYIRE